MNSRHSCFLATKLETLMVKMSISNYSKIIGMTNVS